MLALVMFIAWFLALAVVRGASLDVFWDWFIATPNIWPAAPDLTIGSALGLSFVITFLTYQASADAKQEGDSAITIIAIGIGKSIVFYATVWVTALAYHYLFNIGA